METGRTVTTSAVEIATAMQARGGATELLGITLDAADDGFARVTMTLDHRMLNGHGSAHGGILFLLADTAFAYACNSRNEVNVAQAATISFLSPGLAGETLVAEAREASSVGRVGVWDVRLIGADGRVIAIFQGLSRALGRPVVELHREKRDHA